MLIIFGFTTRVRLLGIVTIACSRCGNPAAHRLEERRRVVTLFFIPVVPLGRRTVLTCTYCGLTSDVEPADVPSLMAQVHGPARARGTAPDLPGAGQRGEQP